MPLIPKASAVRAIAPIFDGSEIFSKIKNLPVFSILNATLYICQAYRIHKIYLADVQYHIISDAISVLIMYKLLDFSSNCFIIKDVFAVNCS